MTTSYWPLLDVRVTTPRVELRAPDQATVLALIQLAADGIHEPGFMPFAHPWTLVPSPRRERESFQFYARCWAEWSPANWQLPFSVWAGDELVGVQGILGVDFAGRGTVETGSWLGQAHQGKGLGKEMRAAVLHFGFAGLGARRAETGAFHDNPRSLGVTAALGYEPNGSHLRPRDGEPTPSLDFALDRASWERRRRDDIEIQGLDECLDMFGATDAA
jgi:RimJ/RimL family protein N-acetyltransferase